MSRRDFYTSIACLSYLMFCLSACAHTVELDSMQTQLWLRAPDEVWDARMHVYTDSMKYICESGAIMVTHRPDDRYFEGEARIANGVSNTAARIALPFHSVHRMLYETDVTVRTVEGGRILARRGRWYFAMKQGKPNSIVIHTHSLLAGIPEKEPAIVIPCDSISSLRYRRVSAAKTLKSGVFLALLFATTYSFLDEKQSDDNALLLGTGALLSLIFFLTL